MSSLRQHVEDFAGASLASFLATAADGALYALLLFVFELVSDEPSTTLVGVAAAIGAVLGGVIHYSLSRFWVFDRFDAPIRRSAVAYLAMSGLAAVIHGVLTAWLSVHAGEALAWFGSKAVVWLAWTYPLSRFVVFGGLGADPHSHHSS